VKEGKLFCFGIDVVTWAHVVCLTEDIEGANGNSDCRTKGRNANAAMLEYSSIDER
jgi:hypothetical protein